MSIKWTEEMITNAAKRYDTRTAFKVGVPGAYDAAENHGILERVCNHMKPVQITWSLQQIMHEAKQFKTRNDFKQQSPQAYNAAVSQGVIYTVCKHMH